MGGKVRNGRQLEQQHPPATREEKRGEARVAWQSKQANRSGESEERRGLLCSAAPRAAHWGLVFIGAPRLRGGRGRRRRDDGGGRRV
jgi:hypothetical protein